MKRIFIAVIALVIQGCVTYPTYPADNALKITDIPTKLDSKNEKEMVWKSIKDIYSALGLKNERAIDIGNIEDYDLRVEKGNLKTSCEQKVIAIATGDIESAFCSGSIFIARGNVTISHSSKNIIIASGSVNIAHDGDDDDGSLVISNKNVKISHAAGSTVYAVDGLEISFSNKVTAFNTSSRKTSWGHINNIEIKPLFKNEPSHL